MARVSEISEASLPEPLRDLYRKFTREYGDFTNQVRVVAHSPDAFLHLYGLIDAWRRTGTLSRRLVEIAVVTASRVNECSYCVGHHGAALIDLGIPAATVDRILDPEPPGLDEKERLVRDYAKLVAERAWCGHLCPVGAFYGAVGGFSPLRIVAVRREQCNDCADCYAVCPEPLVIKPALKGADDGIGPVILSPHCTNCGRCIDVCSKHVFAFGARFSNRRKAPAGAARQAASGSATAVEVS